MIKTIKRTLVDLQSEGVLQYPERAALMLFLISSILLVLAITCGFKL